MKSIQAFACPVCEEIYKTEQGASKCEAACIKAKIEADKERQINAQLEELRNYVRLNAESVEDICKMSMEISKKLNKSQYIKEMTLRVRYVEHVSNSHSSPIGQPTNFGRKSDKPTGYPALYGSILFTYNKGGKLSGSDIFSKWGDRGIKGINTGSGGSRSGNNTYGYDVTLWLDDFPKIKEKIEKLHENIKEFHDFEMEIQNQYSDILEQDVDLAIKQARVKSLNEEILTLSAKRDVIQTESYHIQQKHKAPLAVFLDNKAKQFDNDFGIRVDRSF